MRTDDEPESVDEWWQEAGASAQALFRGLGELIEMLKEGHVLELSRTGQHFQPVLRWERGSTESENPLDEGPGRLPGRASPETWWASLNPRKKEFFRKLTDLLEQVGGDKMLELRRSGRHVTATLVLKFKHPVGGRAEAN